MATETEKILLVTGRLAETSMRGLLNHLARHGEQQFEVAVLGISVAALMHAEWVARKLEIPEGIDRVILPGWCQGDLDKLSDEIGCPCELGPKDLFDLPEYLGSESVEPPLLDEYSIDIIAEINHAPRLTDVAIFEMAERYRRAGADFIDVGCIPGSSWSSAGEVTRRLIDEGFRVSIDSFDQAEVTAAVEAGAELVLSCNSLNRDWVTDLGVEVVVIPDFQAEWETLEETLEFLEQRKCAFRVDPILEPVGFGFGQSLQRYYEARRRWPDVAMMMGVGNLTELTDVDSAGINFILCALCEEWAIGSVLTTEVINWCRTSVAEIDQARRMVHHSLTYGVLPKRLHDGLVRLRDPKLNHLGDDALINLAASLKDPNFRIFAERGEIHVMNRDGYWVDDDPFELFTRLHEESPVKDSSHAFYLGYEMAKALTAITLGKQYRQDQSLRWGDLTLEETSLVEKHRRERES